MATEQDILISARQHRDDLLEEAANRRLLRSSRQVQDDVNPSGRRLQTLLRRIAGAPTFA
jgi:hypothetical protein